MSDLAASRRRLAAISGESTAAREHQGPRVVHAHPYATDGRHEAGSSGHLWRITRRALEHQGPRRGAGADAVARMDMLIFRGNEGAYGDYIQPLARTEAHAQRPGQPLPTAARDMSSGQACIPPC